VNILSINLKTEPAPPGFYTPNKMVNAIFNSDKLILNKIAVII
jgi:hypothetical protein